MKSSGSGSGASSTLTKKPVGTSSILKNADASLPPSGSPATHGGNNSSSSLSSSSSSSFGQPVTTASSYSSPFSSSAMKNFMIGSSNSLSGGGIRPGILPPNASPFDELPPVGGTGISEQGGDSEGDGDDMDDTTTATGSDSSSFKWYETGFDPNFSVGAGTGGDVKSIRVTKGNVLFDYIQVEFGRGVLLSTQDFQGGWADIVRHNFHQSATVIHQILHKAANARQRLEERGNDKKWVSRALAPISEHGILFNCQLTDPRDLNKKKPRKRDVYYWVVGRIYPDEREIFVCYEDGPMSQNLIEIAYKIALHVHS
ncbi:Protein inturned [Orchesella cincta]|uniref:Protein inturned n=1 Tax=Orchesella cincta TaxID=48709 RepID=A0A1D2N805_ORCCI|nr:Protein inturned [Orchesella cincta]